MNKILLLVFLLTCVYACTGFQLKPEPLEPPPPPPVSENPVTSYVYRIGGDLNIEFAIADDSWDYTAVMSNDGVTFTLVIKDVEREMGDLEVIRPLKSVDKTEYPSGFRLVFHLASRHSAYTLKNDLGLKVVLTALDPDMEILSMNTFGSWADPLRPAEAFQGTFADGGKTTVKFDGPPLYSAGEAGGRNYIDVFGVNIIPGTIKHPALVASNNMDGKTRLIFNKKVDVCPDNYSLIIGEKCKGYSGLSGFRREKNEKTESFEFRLPGRPDMTVREMNGIVAFGFKDAKLFSKVLQRFAVSYVYKVEAREKDGMLWLIFLYNGDLKYRKYYSGDRFFVVFYR
ncbi:hypothetical protein Dacet_0285 [Denitrovibrio acetiphilus DSM 12809]|uniref:Lipoprotein n=1 Tax=Denitrovibrio acetiphilus (strain DSM 12809 / NBRC 114555 / N2460) TaxID=522772 RepID=D4H2M4_DENA2|nr:hypothetical protein [Denitrovibrio acetiphilus]ADD67085.1 hypothetical protein Dacet_0285 [Denitrovibrio acetiphilus DSM 12809]